MRYFWRFLIVGIFIISCGRTVRIDTPNFENDFSDRVLLEKNLLGGGLLSEKEIQIASKKGYRTIIDLRTPEEGIEKEKILAQKYNLNYVNIPTSVENLSRKHADKLHEILAREGVKPAIVHCASGNRAAAVWAIYRRLYYGDSGSEVFAQASSKGLKSSLKDRLTYILNSLP